MDNVYTNMERARDGGIAIYEITASGEQTLVFAGNVKEATEYYGARCAKLANPTEVKLSGDLSAKHRATSLPRFSDGGVVPLSSRTLADRITDRDVDQHYADASAV